MNKMTIGTSLVVSLCCSYCAFGTMAYNNNRGVAVSSGKVYCPAENRIVSSEHELGSRKYRFRAPGKRPCSRKGWACGPRDGRGNGFYNGRTPGYGRGLQVGPQDGRGNGPCDGSGAGCR